MRVFHGSYLKVRTIDLSFGRPNKDFGRGFYVTKIKRLAHEWADRKGADNNTKGVVSEFIFDEYIWEDTELNLLRFENKSYTDYFDRSKPLWRNWLWVGILPELNWAIQPVSLKMGEPMMGSNAKGF